MTPTSNRIRGSLTQIHPALERVVGPHLDHPAMLDLFQCYPSPAAMKAAGTTGTANRLLKLAPLIGRRLAEYICPVDGASLRHIDLQITHLEWPESCSTPPGGVADVSTLVSCHFLVRIVTWRDVADTTFLITVGALVHLPGMTVANVLSRNDRT
jgi:hypothetical protein